MPEGTARNGTGGRASLRERAADEPTLPNHDVQSLVHELGVHQAELEIQNEELRKAQLELAESRDRYADLYEFAPVGYVTLDRDGRIREANLAAATLLGTDRRDLLGADFRRFLAPESQHAWREHRQRVFGGAASRICEVGLRGTETSPSFVRLESVGFGPESDRRCRTVIVDVTDLRSAETALRESRERLQVFVEHAPVAIAMFDREMRYVAASRRLRADFLSGRGEVLGRCHYEIFPECPERWRAAHRRGLAGEVVRCEEDHWTTSDGRTVWHRFEVRPWHSADGAVGGIVLFVEDITARKESEAALRELGESLERQVAERTAELKDRSERLRAILDAADDAIVTMDRQGIVEDANPAAERIFGYAQEELLGRSIFLLIAPRAGDVAQVPSETAGTDEGLLLLGLHGESTGRRKDGGLFPIDVSISEVDHLGLFTGIIRDVTARRRAEEEARFEQQFNRQLVGTAQCVVLVLDVAGRIVRYNDYFARLAGRPLEEVRGQDWFETFPPPRLRPAKRAAFRRALAGKRTPPHVGAVVASDGSERLIEWSDAVLTDAEGTLVGLLRTGQDVTEKRRLEREVLEAADEEQRRIGRDLHDGAGQELVAAALLAHDLERTLHESSRPEAARRLRTILGSVERVQRQLRAYAHGLAAVAVEAEGLPAALRSLAERFDDLQGVRCTAECGSDPAVDDAYVATHLYRIAQEAVTNAVRHGAAHRVTIRLSDGDGLHLSVADDGCGIADLERAAHEGLGMRTMRYRAELIGGSLDVSPGARGGTVVNCTWPRNSHDDRPAAS